MVGNEEAERRAEGSKRRPGPGVIQGEEGKGSADRGGVAQDYGTQRWKEFAKYGRCQRQRSRQRQGHQLWGAAGARTPGAEGRGWSPDCEALEETGSGQASQRAVKRWCEVDNMASSPSRFECVWGPSPTPDLWKRVSFYIMCVDLDQFGDSGDKGAHNIAGKKNIRGCVLS